jgi:xanthine dehydrogenase YagR molybdenum-binding subunit
VSTTSTLTAPGLTVGKAITRVDAGPKTQGQALYAADQPVEAVAFAQCVSSTIARGRIVKIDTSKAEAVAGVLQILTHLNAPRLTMPKFAFQESLVPAEHLAPLQSDEVLHAGQHVAVVVAETFEQATYAAGLIEIRYEKHPPVLDLATAPDRFFPESFFGMPLQSSRGDVAAAFVDAAFDVDAEYYTPVTNHNPLEPHATIARWDGEKLTLYDATQGVTASSATIAATFGVPAENVHVISPFVGGGFGCKGFVWPHTVLAAVAARHVGRAVKLVLTRHQMFGSVGHRTDTRQRVHIASDKRGRFTAIEHRTTMHTSFAGEFFEPAGNTTNFLYSCANVKVSHEAVRLNLGTPCPMRAPGEAPGLFALESALDELAATLEIDPIELRRINHATRDESGDLPFSSKHLLECYERGAERIGWAQRAAPRARREGHELIGLGMATATYPGLRDAASVRIVLETDGHAIVESGTQDIGTGTYTIMAQVAADALGLPMDRIEARLGDSSLPRAPISGGSQSAASVMPAVDEAARMVRDRLIALSIAEGAPFEGSSASDISVENGRLIRGGDFANGVSYGDVLRENGAIQATASLQPEEGKAHVQSFGAQFAEVRVDEELGRVRVSRFVGVFDCGKIINQKTARSQMLGGIIYGIGMALFEETLADPVSGRLVTSDLAQYLVPVNADIPEIEIDFIEFPDYRLNSLGIRGVGEIGITGVAAAVANAVHNATGKRVRDLPILPEKILSSAV